LMSLSFEAVDLIPKVLIPKFADIAVRIRLRWDARTVTNRLWLFGPRARFETITLDQKPGAR